MLQESHAIRPLSWNRPIETTAELRPWSQISRVPVGERGPMGSAIEPGCNTLPDVMPHLLCGRSNSRHRAATPRHCRGFTDREYVGMPRKREIGIHRKAASAITFDVHPFASWGGVHSCCPNDCRGQNSLAISQNHTVCIATGDQTAVRTVTTIRLSEDCVYALRLSGNAGNNRPPASSKKIRDERGSMCLKSRARA